MLGGSLDGYLLIVGGVAAVLAIFESARRILVGMWRVGSSLVRFGDALPDLLKLAEHADKLATAEQLQAHADDDAAFQEWIMGRIEDGAT